MENIKKLTILHSNDLHGDFLAERIDEKLIGGVSMLSGYVGKVRREEIDTFSFPQKGENRKLDNCMAASMRPNI